MAWNCCFDLPAVIGQRSCIEKSAEDGDAFGHTHQAVAGGRHSERTTLTVIGDTQLYGLAGAIDDDCHVGRIPCVPLGVRDRFLCDAVQRCPDGWAQVTEFAVCHDLDSRAEITISGGHAADVGYAALSGERRHAVIAAK